MSNPISVRLKGKDQEKIADIVDEEGTTTSALIAKIVHDWIHFGRLKENNGDITLANQILKTRHDAIKKNEIPKIIKRDADFIIEQMEYQVDELDFDEVAKRIREWNKENGLSLMVIEKKDEVVFKQRHMLGATWSEIQCKMYSEMFRKINEIVDDVKYSKNSFSFKVIRQLQR